MKLTHKANYVWRALPPKIAALKASDGQKNGKIGLILMNSVAAGPAFAEPARPASYTAGRYKNNNNNLKKNYEKTSKFKKDFALLRL